MSEQELYTLLTSLSASIPVAYDHFTSKVKPTFILYRNNDTTTFSADDKIRWKKNNYIVDLITDKKDTTTEQSLETLFDNNYLPYTKMEDFIDEEQIYQIRYYI